MVPRSRSRLTAAISAIALAAGMLTLGPASPSQAAPAVPATAATNSAAADLLPEPKVVPIQVTGPATERLNLIVFGDGYQADQQGLFMGDLDRNLAVMWASEPFRSYKNYINIYAVQVPSIDYGVHCDPDGRVRHPDPTIRDTGEREGPLATKNTALRLTLTGCNNPLARGITYGGAPANCAAQADKYPAGVNPCETGIQAQRRILDTYVAPVIGIPRTAQNLQTLALSNTFTYGGIGGRDATTSGGSPQGPVVSLHELGHSLGTLLDEYPYNSRDIIRPCFTGTEAQTSFHHTTYTSTEKMIADQHKWWRWIGEESISGGKIGLHEGGGLYPCGQRRPSQNSMMRWVGYEFDQIGREHMVARVTGMRDSAKMVVTSTPEGTVPAGSALWTEAGQPRFHDLTVTWRTGGATGPVLATGANRSLDLGDHNLPAGTIVHVEVRDPVGPDGIDWVRNPSTNSSATDSGYNGPRFVQTRQWTVGTEAVVPSAPQAEITLASSTTEPLAREEIAFVRTNHPSDRLPTVTWRIDGKVVQTGTLTVLDLKALTLSKGAHDLTVTVADPADPAAATASRAWKIDAALPTAPRTLSKPLVSLGAGDSHGVYFDGWDMLLEPVDSTEGYDSQRYVVGQLRLDGGGWQNYSGFPEKPMPDSPFEFRHSGTELKALVYGNLGTGGLSRAAFEQTLPDDHPSGGFVPGFGTHKVEHRAIDPVGNIGDADSYQATVLPGALLECTGTLTGPQQGLTLTAGTTCLDKATVNGDVTVGADASVVIRDSVINGFVTATKAAAVQMFGTTVRSATRISEVGKDVTVAGNTFRAGLTLNNNTQASANERFSRLAGAYGPVVSGNTVFGGLACVGNSAAVSDFGAKNTVGGAKTGTCKELGTAATSTPAFADVPVGADYHDEIRWMADAGISTGKVDGSVATFSPGRATTRQDFAAFLYRLSHNGVDAPACTVAPYADVPASSTFCGAISWLKGQNITTGFAGNTFRPGVAIERQAMAAFLFRYTHPGVTAPACTTAPYRDVPVSGAFCGEISWLKSQNITTGFPDGSFQPVNTVQRQAAAAFLSRLSMSSSTK
ncbi:peptidase M64 [Nakamurella silvestris]|nr:peptidase M64 [Nakamurella silvestris]